MSALTDLFTNIANAIRSKTGSSASIVASDFPTEIANIPTGGNIEIDYSNQKSMASSAPSYEKYISKLKVDASNLTSLAGFFYRSLLEIADDIEIINTSNVTNISYMFYYCTTLKKAPLFDTSAVTNANHMFRGCSNLESIPAYNFSAPIDVQSGNFTEFAAACTNLKDVAVMNLSGLTGRYTSGNISLFGSCPNLTNESLQNILKSLLTMTNYQRPRTLKCIGLSSDQATTCTTFDEWTTLSANGWTTGY